MTENAYARLAEPFRRFIYKQRWDGLTTLQEQAIQAVMDTDESIVISAGTASGKTEAALFPVLSRLVENPKPGVCMLYMSPLKALINDQHRRLQDMLKETPMGVLKYHSDVGEKKKRTFGLYKHYC